MANFMSWFVICIVPIGALAQFCSATSKLCTLAGEDEVVRFNKRSGLLVA